MLDYSQVAVRLQDVGFTTIVFQNGVLVFKSFGSIDIDDVARIISNNFRFSSRIHGGKQAVWVTK